ncbi:MAG: hypothetical protein K2Q14_03855 [Gammaproteobacteria bacterium]|nr:hypothetical protein [Gammaproteobacteria bacterium]
MRKEVMLQNYINAVISQEYDGYFRDFIVFQCKSIASEAYKTLITENYSELKLEKGAIKSQMIDEKRLLQRDSIAKLAGYKFRSSSFCEIDLMLIDFSWSNLRQVDMKDAINFNPYRFINVISLDTLKNIDEFREIALDLDEEIDTEYMSDIDTRNGLAAIFDCIMLRQKAKGQILNAVESRTKTWEILMFYEYLERKIALHEDRHAISSIIDALEKGENAVELSIKLTTEDLMKRGQRLLKQTASPLLLDSFTANIPWLEHRNNEYELIDLLKSCEEKKSRNNIFYIARAKFPHAHVNHLSTPHVQTPSMTIDTMTVSSTTNVHVSPSVSNNVSNSNTQPGEITMPTLNENTPFDSYSALIRYDAELVHALPQEASLSSQRDRVAALLLLLISRLSGQTEEIRGLSALIHYPALVIQQAVIGRLKGVGEPLLRAGFYPWFYETVQEVADTLAYAAYPEPANFPARELVELLKLFLNDAVKELTIMGVVNAPRPLLALQTAIRLAECLLLNHQCVFGLDYLAGLRELAEQLAGSLHACRRTHVLHAFWGESLAQGLKAMTHRLTPEETSQFKQGVALEVAKTLGAGGKGLVYLGMGTTSLGVAIALSVTVGAFHLLPEAILSFGEGVYELLKSGYEMKEHLSQARQQWKILHPPEGNPPSELAEQQQRRAEVAAALWTPLAQQLTKVTPQQLQQLDNFTLRWWVYHLTALLKEYPAPDEVVWLLRSVFLTIYRQFTEQPDIQRFVLLHSQQLAHHGYPAFDFTTLNDKVLHELIGYAPTPEALTQYADYCQAKQQASNHDLTHHERRAHKAGRDRLKPLLLPHLAHFGDYHRVKANLESIKPYLAQVPTPPVNYQPVTLKGLWFETFPLDKTIYDLGLSYEAHLRNETLEKNKAGLYDKLQKVTRDKHAHNLSDWGNRTYDELNNLMKTWEKDMKKQSAIQSSALVQAKKMTVKKQHNLEDEVIASSGTTAEELIKIQQAVRNTQVDIALRCQQEGVNLPHLVDAGELDVGEQLNQRTRVGVNPGVVQGMFVGTSASINNNNNNNNNNHSHASLNSNTQSNVNEVSGIIYRKENDSRHWIEFDYLEITIEPTRLQPFIQDQGMDDALGYIEESATWNNKKTLIKSVAFSSEKAVSLFMKNLRQEIDRLQREASVSTNLSLVVPM